MNQTSTEHPAWIRDCDQFAKQKEVFKLQNVSCPEHEAFCRALCTTRNMKTQQEGNTVTFTPSS